MKSRLLIQAVVVVSIVLLCVGLGVHSFLRLNSVEDRQNFDLYMLVPPDATVILETDRMAELVEDINELDCSKDNHFLYVSELFVCLKNCLHTLVEDTPHGLSKQMNKMLISFHEPDTPMNQVLYCSLGEGDYELVESFVEKYCSSAFPSKCFDYKGEEIRIYSMADGRFLAAYVTSDFLVVSFQKRLIEGVIDARQSGRSLMALPSFRDMYVGKRNNVSAAVYVRMKGVDMGRTTDSLRLQVPLGSWAEFDVKFDGEAIYCSGISHGADSTQVLIHALRAQQPMEDGFPGGLLPSSTFFYDCRAMSDKNVWFDFTVGQVYSTSVNSEYVKQRDEEWIAYLNEYAGESVMSCLFQSKDTLDKQPCVVVCIPLKDELAAAHRLQSLLYSTPEEKDAPPIPKVVSNRSLYPKASNFLKYVLPRNTLLAQLTGVADSALYTFACFYRGNLLLAPDALSLSAYVEAVESGDVLGGMPMYEGIANSLSPTCNFAMMVDMEAMLAQPERYARLVPNFFFRQFKFFSRFVLAMQFTCTGGVLYPNIVLYYKGEEEV